MGWYTFPPTPYSFYGIWENHKYLIKCKLCCLKNLKVLQYIKCELWVGILIVSFCFKPLEYKWATLNKGVTHHPASRHVDQFALPQNSYFYKCFVSYENVYFVLITCCQMCQNCQTAQLVARPPAGVKLIQYTEKNIIVDILVLVFLNASWDNRYSGTIDVPMKLF